MLLAVGILLSLTGCARADARDAYERATDCLLAGDYEQAEELYRKVVDAGEFLPYAYRGLGLSYMYRAIYPEACVSFERCLLNVENEGAEFMRDANLYLAHCRELHAEEEKALDIYNTMLKKETDPEVLFLRGRLYLKNGNQEAARADFDKAASLSTDYNLYISIYQLYNEAHMDADGAEFLEMALAMAEQSEDADYSRGVVYYYLQNYNESKAQLMSALEKNPKNTDAMLLLGRVYLAMDDVANARAMFKEHIEDKDLAATSYNGLALCDIAEGQYEDALLNVRSGLAINDPKARQALQFNEIVIYENLHQWELAKTKAAAYVTSYPADEKGARENEFLNSRSMS